LQGNHLIEPEIVSFDLSNREIIFEDFQPMWSRYLNVTDRRTTLS